MLQSLFNTCVAGLQVCNFIKKRFQHKCFSVNVAKFFKMYILKKICELLLLSNVGPNFSSGHLKMFSKMFLNAFAGKHLYHSVLFNKNICKIRQLLRPIYIQKEVPAQVFS